MIKETEENEIIDEGMKTERKKNTITKKDVKVRKYKRAKSGGTYRVISVRARVGCRPRKGKNRKGGDVMRDICFFCEKQTDEKLIRSTTLRISVHESCVRKYAGRNSRDERRTAANIIADEIGLECKARITESIKEFILGILERNGVRWGLFFICYGLLIIWMATITVVFENVMLEIVVLWIIIMLPCMLINKIKKRDEKEKES